MNVIDRFLHYVSFDTQSSETSMTCPSTAKRRIIHTAMFVCRKISWVNARNFNNARIFGPLQNTVVRCRFNLLRENGNKKKFHYSSSHFGRRTNISFFSVSISNI